MEFICKFEDKLFALKQKGKKLDEYDSIKYNWSDIGILEKFADKHNIVNFSAFVDDIQSDLYKIIEIFYKIRYKNEKLEYYFKQLSPSDFKNKLPSKRKINNLKYLRVYAIKIDEECFIVTGSAIKLHRTMQEQEETLNELLKLNKVQNYLINNDIYDKIVFLELF